MFSLIAKFFLEVIQFFNGDCIMNVEYEARNLVKMFYANNQICQVKSDNCETRKM